jgi:hypothetical protein
MRCSWAAVVGAGVLCGLTAPAGAAEPWSLALTVEEPLGVARAAEPVSGGIPLPAGKFKAGQAVAHVLYQEKHGTFHYDKFLVDFPVKGFAWDWLSWRLEPGATGPGNLRCDGYEVLFHPDVAARAYEVTGDEFLKQRAAEMYLFGTHAGTFDRKAITRPGRWVNVYSTHDESVAFTGKTMYVWAHPREDTTPPAPVSDLKVALDGGKATVSFTAPVDRGGKTVRYQVKASDKPIVDYATFLQRFAANTEKDVTNFWMAANLAGEPTPQPAGAGESFTVTGVPAGARYFVVVSFDDSGNRSALSNVAERP